MPPEEDRADERRTWETPTLTTLDSRVAVRQNPGGFNDDGPGCSSDGNIACS